MAALVPKPIMKLPMPTIAKFAEPTSMIRPIILMIQAARYVFFLP